MGGRKMKLIKIIVKNYRQFEKVELDFGNDVTILAGSNNSGKTSLITLVRNIVSDEKVIYTETDIPAKNMKLWVDKVFPMFEDFFNNIKNIEQIEDDLVSKILPQMDNEEKILIDTTEIYIQVDYNAEIDDIKLFADYIMDLDEDKHSFYFIYCFEINRRLFAKKVLDNYDKLKKRFEELTETNRDLKYRYLHQMLVNIYVNSIRPVCYFCDKHYDNRCKMDDVNEFRKLFNFTYIKASRPLDDDDTDHAHTLSKQMIRMVKFDEKWNALINLLPDELLKPIQDRKIDERVRETSLKSLKDTINALEQTNGGKTGELMLDMNVTEEDISDLLQNITTATYNVDGYYLGEASQGLGYSNMIYMHLQLKEYEKSIDPLKVNMFFIEEPESHMHPQMQQVFIKYLINYYKEKELQGVATTHSNEMVRVAGISHLRVIRRTGDFKSDLYNPSLLITSLKQSKNVEDEELANFFDWFFEIGYSEIVFADKAILYEGDTERLLIKKLLTLPKYENLSQQYIAYIQVGGAYAYNYRKLIELLKIKTLIITDLDYEKKGIEINDIEKSTITNETIRNFYSEFSKEEPDVKHLYEWKKTKGNILNDGLIYVAYQTVGDAYARTLEEAMLGKYFEMNVAKRLKRSEWCVKKEDSKLKFSIPHNKEGEEDSEFSLRDILKSSSGIKTDFMYSVIMNGLVETMEPQYISEGLQWLME